jgi:NADH-ubiquinone oxidoreductase chain 5
MYLSIIILPLLGSVVAGFFGRKVGIRGAQLITSLVVIITTVFALLVFLEVGFNNISVSINSFK